MSEGLESVTRSSLSWALDVAALRHQVIAQNIANASADNYARQRVDFDAQMRAARSQLDDRGRLESADLTPVIAGNTPVQTVMGPNGDPAPVQLDIEVADMAQNAVHYQALLKGLSRHMGILSLAVSDGKR